MEIKRKRLEIDRKSRQQGVNYFLRDYNWAILLIVIFTVSYYSFHKEIDILLGFDKILKPNGKQKYYYWFLADGFWKVAVSLLIMIRSKTKGVSFLFFGLCFQNFVDEVTAKAIGFEINEIYAAIFILFLSILLCIRDVKHGRKYKNTNS